MSAIALACRDNCADYLRRAEKETSPILKRAFELKASDWLAKAQEWERKFYPTTTEETR